MWIYVFNNYILVTTEAAAPEQAAPTAVAEDNKLVPAEEKAAEKSAEEESSEAESSSEEEESEEEESKEENPEISVQETETKAAEDAVVETKGRILHLCTCFKVVIKHQPKIFDLCCVTEWHGETVCDVRCVCALAEVIVVHAEGEAVPAITVTIDDIFAEDKNKGAYEQLKELLVSDKQQQVRADTPTSSLMSLQDNLQFVDIYNIIFCTAVQLPFVTSLAVSL